MVVLVGVSCISDFRYSDLKQDSESNLTNSESIKKGEEETRFLACQMRERASLESRKTKTEFIIYNISYLS